MSVLRIDHHPARRQLNLFGLIWLGFFAVIGGILLAKAGWSPALAAWTAAVVVPVVGWLAPAFMRWVYVGMAYLAFPIGFVISHLILAAVYYLLLTPIGLLMRLCGHDPMCRGFDRQAESYWVPREPSRDPQRYLRQF